MYSILFSRIEMGMDLVKEEIKKMLPENARVAIFPWAFPVELNAEKLETEFFKKGIDEVSIIICNCYSDSKEKLKKVIKESDLLLLPGGNPEMFFQKVVHDTDLLYNIKYYNGIIIGESAGAELQLKRYFITAKNNYYKYFAFYDGFGILDDPFYFDVHSSNNKIYLNTYSPLTNQTISLQIFPILIAIYSFNSYFFIYLYLC